ncbi:MAG: hypothetical protein NZL91_02835 [Thermoflexales bacterium]|nr:hypothetical protein [Thermoflexales bacterium]
MIVFSHEVVHVFQGNDLGKSPQVAVFTVPSRVGGGRDTLLVFLDLPSASAQVCNELARTLVEGYTRAPGGMTSALRLAINLVNDRAVQLNRGAIPSRRIEGSVSCALLTGDGLVLAQAGPAIAFARAANGAFEVIEPWFNGQPQLVGIAPRVDVFFNHFSVKPGDVFVLSGARSIADVSEELIEVCMSKGDARMVAGYLNANVKRGRMVGIAISADVPPAAGAAFGASSPLASSQSSSQPVSAPAGAPAVAPSPTPSADAKRAAARRTTEAAPSVFQRVGAALWHALGMLGRVLARAFSALLSRVLPDDNAVSVSTPSARVITFALAATAVLVPIVVGVLVGVLYFQFSGEAERLQLRASAQALVEQARQARTAEEVKARWTTALRAINAYEAQAPDDRATFAEARREARARLDEVLGVVRVPPNVLASFDRAARRRISVTPLGVYVLDLEANVVSFQRFNLARDALVDQPLNLLFDGQRTAPVPLVDIAHATTLGNRWRTEGAVLFSHAAVYEYSSATGRAVPLSVPETNGVVPSNVQSGALFDNRVYLLDTGTGQIWRYTLVNDGLSNANSTYFRSPYPALRESVDFAVDGAVYVLQRSGAVMKYFNRQEAGFVMSGLPEPLVQPVALALRGDAPDQGSVFILDSGNGAIIELRKDGAFVRQFRAEGDEFVGAHDLAVDASGQFAIVAGRDRLYRFLLP